MNKCLKLIIFAINPISMIKTQVYFRFRVHPGDLYRSTDIIELPDPEKDQDTFLVQFLPNYQSDQNVAYLNDLYKIFHDEFSDDEDKENILKTVGDKTLEQVDKEIKRATKELYVEALRNFNKLVLNDEIEIINDEQEQQLD